MPSFIVRKKNKVIMPDHKRSSFWTWAGRFFMGLGVMMFVMILISFISFYAFVKGGQGEKPLPTSFVLVQELTGSMPEFNRSGGTFWDMLLPPQQSLYGFMHALATAKEDDRVKALAVRLHDGNYSLTQIESLRNAVIDFRESGKKTYLYTDSFGGFSNGTGAYWLASAFDEISVQPVGNVSLNGIRIEQPHAAEILDRLGVKPEIITRKEYKTAPEYMTHSEMSPESRETLAAIAEDILGKIIVDIQKSRHVPLDVVENAIDNSPLTAEQALDMKLIDHVQYADQLENMLKLVVDRDNESFVSLARYTHDLRKKSSDEPSHGIARVAIVTIDGMILANPTPSRGGMMGGDLQDAGDIAVSIMNAADDDDIKLLLLRINSPGGSPTAAETIRRAVSYAREKGKYVIASMGDVAASGGYWVAVDANEIIASDLTLTGSIGVYGGKVNLSGLWDKIGVNWEAVEFGRNASMWSPNTGYGADELVRLNAMMDDVYDAFVTRVANGRHMDINDVEKAAKGRAWTGKAARANGLVDLNGGLEFALKRAAGEAEVGDWRSMRFVLLPRASDPFSDLVSFFGIKSQDVWPKQLTAFKNEILKAWYHPQSIVTAPTINISY